MSILQQLKGNYFVFRDNGNIIQIPYGDIICLSVVKHYIEITTKKEVHSIRMSLKSVLPFLPKEFVQCHRGYIVNMRHEYADFSMRLNV